MLKVLMRILFSSNDLAKGLLELSVIPLYGQRALVPVRKSSPPYRR